MKSPLLFLALGGSYLGAAIILCESVDSCYPNSKAGLLPLCLEDCPVCVWARQTARIDLNYSCKDVCLNIQRLPEKTRHPPLN